MQQVAEPIILSVSCITAETLLATFFINLPSVHLSLQTFILQMPLQRLGGSLWLSNIFIFKTFCFLGITVSVVCDPLWVKHVLAFSVYSVRNFQHLINKFLQSLWWIFWCFFFSFCKDRTDLFLFLPKLYISLAAQKHCCLTAWGLSVCSP